MQERRYDSQNPFCDPQPDRSPELELLLLCARWPLRSEDRELIRDRSAGTLDWRLFLRLARHHRLEPLVYHALRASIAKRSTSQCDVALTELQQVALSSAHQALRTLAELRRIVQKLQANGVPVRVLKGLPLAQSTYGDLSLRPAGDLDLLIGVPSITQADHVLRAFGYRAALPLDRLSPRRLAFYRSHWKDLIYKNPASDFEVDLHWRCFRNPAMPGAELCTVHGQEGVSFGSFRVDTLPRMEGLLYLCVHGALDGWIYLKSLVDVAAQVRDMPEADLDAFATLAAGYGILPELSATLIMVRRYLSMDHWSARLLAADDRTVKVILRYADQVLVQGGFLATRESIPIATTIAFEFGLRRNLRYRLEPLVRILFRVRMWEAIPLPDWLFWIYPLLSPFEWLIFRIRQRAAKPSARATLTI